MVKEGTCGCLPVDGDEQVPRHVRLDGELLGRGLVLACSSYTVGAGAQGLPRPHQSVGATSSATTITANPS